MNTNNDRQHLKILSIFHYIFGGIITFLSLLFLRFFIMVITMTTSPESLPMEPPGELLIRELDYLFVARGVASVLLLESLAISTIFSGWFLKKHRRYWFSFITACILCLFTPFGTILGVFTIIVLSRESVKELYGVSQTKNSAINQDDRT